MRESSSSLLSLDVRFIHRVLVTTAWVGAVVFLCLAGYRGLPASFAWAVGVLIGEADLAALHALIREVMGARRRLALICLGFVKFVVIYGLGAAALILLRVSPWLFLAGFSLFLVVASLKILGRFVLSAAPRKYAGCHPTDPRQGNGDIG